MEINEIIEKLESLSDEKYKAHVTRLGIPAKNSLGVSIVNIRALAKLLKKENTNAAVLWKTGYHETKLLAVLLMDKKETTLDQIEILMPDVVSWDLCNHLCNNLVVKLPDYKTLIYKWCGSDKTWYKRAAYALMTSALIHDTDLDADNIRDFLAMIRENACDGREPVKQALAWALREIGKKGYAYLDDAITLAYELKDSGDKNKAWIGRNTLKELETLTRAEGRVRLISSKSKMGKEAAEKNGE